MSDSSSSSLCDSDGMLKCKSPPRSKAKFIDRNLKIDSDDRSSDDSDSDDDMQYDTSRSPSPKREEITLEYKYSKSDDEEDGDNDNGCSEIPFGQQLTLKMRYCWTIDNFSSCRLNTEGFINSKIYTAGYLNELQWFFRIERLKQEKEVYYGVHAKVLTYSESEAKVEFRGYIVELRGHSYRLASSTKFPRKEGFQFVGYMRKSHIRDDDYWYYRMIPEDELTLSFRVNIQFVKFKKELINDLTALWREKKFADCTLIVKDQEIPAHKAILAARSSYFAELFETKKRSAKIKIDEFEPEMMTELLRFMYTGSTKKLIKFLKQFSLAAEKFKIKELKEICDIAIKSYT